MDLRKSERSKRWETFGGEAQKKKGRSKFRQASSFGWYAPQGPGVAPQAGQGLTGGQASNGSSTPNAPQVGGGGGSKFGGTAAKF